MRERGMEERPTDGPFLGLVDVHILKIKAKLEDVKTLIPN